MNKITRNAARCKKCGDLLESVHRHDYKECSCGAIMVDGGLDYIRRGWHSNQGTQDELIEELSEYANG